MPLSRDECFEVLGIASSASEAEIKTAYKKLALKTHPDKNPDDPDANKVLPDPHPFLHPSSHHLSPSRCCLFCLFRNFCGLARHISG